MLTAAVNGCIYAESHCCANLGVSFGCNAKNRRDLGSILTVPHWMVKYSFHEAVRTGGAISELGKVKTGQME